MSHLSKIPDLYLVAHSLNSIGRYSTPELLQVSSHESFVTTHNSEIRGSIRVILLCFLSRSSSTLISISRSFATVSSF